MAVCDKVASELQKSKTFHVSYQVVFEFRVSDSALRLLIGNCYPNLYYPGAYPGFSEGGGGVRFTKQANNQTSARLG